MEDRSLFGHQGDVVVDASAMQRYVTHVFTWMVAGLAVTGSIAWWFADSGLISMLYTDTGMSMLGWVVTLAPLGFILAMNFGFERFSATGLSAVFLLFSATMGMSLSYIFVVYNLGSIATVFAITAGTFAIMAAVGYTTKTDLTRFGSLLMMALIGIILASLVNLWIGSERMDYIISILGVLIFTGLIAYDTQKIKQIGATVGLENERGRKLALLGATSLYLDFINLFLFLLRLLGRRD
ncbi:MAG: Bax inhibitor-1/YccA family protein [Flavobacteriales bacterium]